MKKRALWFAFAALLLLLTGCKQPNVPTESPKITPSPTLEVKRDAKTALLARMERMFGNSTEKIAIWYWAESGSSPCIEEGFSKDTYLPKLKELISACDWEAVEGDIPENQSDEQSATPEGGAYFLWLYGVGRCSISRGSPYLSFEKPDESGVSCYRTEDYEALYLGLEKLYYEKCGPLLKEYMLGELTAVCGTGAASVKLNKATEELSGAANGQKITDCFNDAAWIQLPGGPREIPDGAHLLISGAEGRSFTLYEEGPYLLLDNYPWMKLADADSVFSDISALIQPKKKTPKVESPPPRPTVGEGSEEVPGWIDAIIKGTDDLRLEYFADGASGPSLTHSSWGNSDVDGLSAILSAYVWEKTDEPLDNQEWTEEMNPPEGGAYRIRLLGKSGFCEMDCGYSKRLCFRGADGSTDYYTTTDYDGFYEAMERFCYQMEWQNIRTHLWSNLDEKMAGRTLMLSRSDGTEHNVAWADISGEIKQLLESRVWIFLPEGSQKLDSEGERLTLSTGEEYIDLIAYAQDGYLQTPGYLYKAVDENGEVDSLYSELCNLLADK